MIQTVDNYFFSETNSPNYYFYFNKPQKDEIKVIGTYLGITFKQFISERDNVFFSFLKDEDKKQAKNADDLIISIQKSGDNYKAQTGNYVGKFTWDGLEIDIHARFSNDFLERMLNFANDIFLDDVSITGKKVDKNFDISKYIIYYMFVQSLEKAFLLGLPKAYKSVQHHEMKLKGKIDINRFIKSDIPFKGKISSTSREQHEIQELIDTIYKAIKVIDKSGQGFTRNISHIKTHLKQHRSNSYVSNGTINTAMQSKALQNPIFAPYKQVLEYARFIINGNNLEENKNGDKKTYGFLVNVAELFEIYMTKLLRKEFPEWTVESPKLPLYFSENMFYARNIIPDIIMTRGKDVMVFDTKYKRMKMRGTKEGIWDVDRNDFFQINTYMSYYRQKGYNVIAGGLLYPMDKFEEKQCHSQNWFDDFGTKFIVDGIDLSELARSDKTDNEQNFKIDQEKILKAERKFIERINLLIPEFL